MPVKYRSALHATSPQNSVWITPDPLAEKREILGGGKINVESLLLLEARPCAGESDAEIVAGAWDFERINRRHARHLIRRGGVWEERRILCDGNPDGDALPGLRYALLGGDGARGVAGGGDERARR